MAAAASPISPPLSLSLLALYLPTTSQLGRHAMQCRLQPGIRNRGADGWIELSVSLNDAIANSQMDGQAIMARKETDHPRTELLVITGCP